MVIKNKGSLSLWLRAALIVAMAATVLFIFVNSTLPKEASSAQSGVVEEIVDKVIPDEVPVKDMIIENIRKIAHFSEYGLLGIEVAVYIFFFLRKRICLFAPLSLLLSALVGFLDESIQMLSDRGPMISDVWIDIGGFTTFTLITYGALYAGLGILTLWRRRAKNKQTDGDEECDVPVK